MTTLPSIIGITGYAGVGKDTVADVLVSKLSYEKRSFAEPIRKVLYDLNPIVETSYDGVETVRDIVHREGWDEGKRYYPELRELMKNLGNAMREHVNAGVWAAKALEHRPERLVIADVRFLNEAEVIKAMGGTTIRVSRPNVAAESAFEREVDSIPTDAHIVNDGTIADLERSIERLFFGIAGRPSVNDEFNAIVREANARRAAQREQQQQIQFVSDPDCPSHHAFFVNGSVDHNAYREARRTAANEAAWPKTSNPFRVDL